MWGSWYLPRFLFKGGPLTLMTIASLMVLGKPCGSLPTMEKLSNVMLCSIVWKWSIMVEGRSEMFLVSFTKTSACFPYVFHVAIGLIASVPVHDLPFLDDTFFVLGYYQEFLNCVGTFKVNLDSCFVTYVPKSLTKAFGIWDYSKLLWFLLYYVGLCCCVIVFGWVWIPFWLGVCWTPNQENCICRVLFGCVGFLVLITVGWNKHAGTCVTVL